VRKHQRLEGSPFKKKPNIRTHLNFIDLSLCKYVDSIYRKGQNRVERYCTKPELGIFELLNDLMRITFILMR